MMKRGYLWGAPLWIGGLLLLFILAAAGRHRGPDVQASPSASQAPSASPSAEATKDPAVRGERAPVAEDEVVVRRVIDGDTIVLESGQIVRYIGIDAPETGRPRSFECFSAEATTRNRELVEGKLVRLEKDVSETDKYGRILRYAYAGDALVNEALVRDGYATAYSYPPDVRYRELFRLAEAEARETKRGLWSSACAAEEPRRSPDTPRTKNARPGTLPDDRNCSDFQNRAEAQAFFESQGGPAADPHRLDRDGDGMACESLP